MLFKTENWISPWGMQTKANPKRLSQIQWDKVKTPAVEFYVNLNSAAVIQSNFLKVVIVQLYELVLSLCLVEVFPQTRCIITQWVTVSDLVELCRSAWPHSDWTIKQIRCCCSCFHLLPHVMVKAKISVDCAWFPWPFSLKHYLSGSQS